MNLSIKFAILTLVSLNISMVHGATIRVIAVKEPGVDASYDADIVIQMDEIVQSINRSPGNTVAVSLVNFGIPAPLTASITGSTWINQSISARNNSLLNELRNDSIADLAIAYVNNLPGGICGYGYQPNWSTGGGMQPALGPDLRGQDLYFVALVSVQSHCLDFRSHVYAAHEMSHLMGAGHHYPGFNGLISGESYGDFIDPELAVNNLGVATFMSISGTTQTQCYNNPPNVCINLDQLSSTQTQSTPSFNFNFSNVKAVNKTAPSVALYREPGCSITPPILMSGYILDICYGGNLETRHRVNWVDLCIIESDRYKLSAQQPTGGTNPYNYFGTVYSPTAIVLVNGQDSRIKARACDGLIDCTSLSSSSYTAQFHECH